MWLSSGRSAHVVNFYTLFTYSLFRRRFGYAPFRLLIKFSAIHVYARTCACPEKAARMYFGRISLEHVLGMIDFPQIVQTMIRQVICAELSDLSVSTYIAITRSNNYRTNYSAISATETKIDSPLENFCRQHVIDMRRYRIKLTNLTRLSAIKDTIRKAIYEDLFYIFSY